MNYEKLGISPEEYRTYTEILKKPPKSISILAKKVKIKRSTLYSVLENLEQKGLIEKTPFKSEYRWIAASPQDLLTLAQTNRDQVEEQLRKLQKQIPLLKVFAGGELAEEEAEIFTYYNDELFAQMYEIVGKSLEQMWGISNYHWIQNCFHVNPDDKVKPSDYLETIMRVGDRFAFTGDKKALKEARQFLNLNPQLKGHWEPRWISKKKFNFDMNINTYEDKTLVTTTPEKGQKMFTIFIRNEKIARNLQELSRFLWENALEIK